LSRPSEEEGSRKRADEWVSEILAEALLNQRRRAMEKLKPLAAKKRRGERLTRRDIERGMEILCYKSFAFCCDIPPKGKRCGYRDSLLRVLGLTRNDYRDYKERCKKLFWRVLRERGIV